MDDCMGATNKQCVHRADATLRVETSTVLIYGFGERHDLSWRSL